MKPAAQQIRYSTFSRVKLLIIIKIFIYCLKPRHTLKGRLRKCNSRIKADSGFRFRNGLIYPLSLIDSFQLSLVDLPTYIGQRGIELGPLLASSQYKLAIEITLVTAPGPRSVDYAPILIPRSLFGSKNVHYGLRNSYANMNSNTDDCNHLGY